MPVAAGASNVKPAFPPADTVSARLRKPLPDSHSAALKRHDEKHRRTKLPKVKTGRINREVVNRKFIVQSPDWNQRTALSWPAMSMATSRAPGGILAVTVLPPGQRTESSVGGSDPASTW